MPPSACAWRSADLLAHPIAGRGARPPAQGCRAGATDPPTGSCGGPGARVARGAHPGGRRQRVVDGGERVDRPPLGAGGPRDRAPGRRPADARGGADRAWRSRPCSPASSTALRSGPTNRFASPSRFRRWSYIAFIESGLSQWEVERGDTRPPRLAWPGRRWPPNDRAILWRSPSRPSAAGAWTDSVAVSRMRVGAFAKAIDGYSQVGDWRPRPRRSQRLRARPAPQRRHRRGRRRLSRDAARMAARGQPRRNRQSARVGRVRGAEPGRPPRAARGSSARPRRLGKRPRRRCSPYERAEYDAAVATVRERLDGPTLESAWSDGRRLSTDEAVAMALATL